MKTNEFQLAAEEIHTVQTHRGRSSNWVVVVGFQKNFYSMLFNTIKNIGDKGMKVNMLIRVSSMISYYPKEYIYRLKPEVHSTF